SEMSNALDYAEESGSKDFGDPSHSSVFKLIPFIQILEKAQDMSSNVTSGYDFIPFLYQAARKVDTVSANNQEKRDFFYETLSDFMQQDTRLFFSAWGMNISGSAKNKVQSKGYDLLVKEL